jgi:hypothetical protein
MYLLEAPNKNKRSCKAIFTIAFVEQENPLFGRLLNPLDFISSNN